jgi:hypothetical protein
LSIIVSQFLTGFICNFQMEPSPTLSFEDDLHQLVSLGLYVPIETLIRNQPYLVLHADLGTEGIYVLLVRNFNEESVVIRLPQSSHVGFRRLITINRLNNVYAFFLEYIGETDDGNPILHVFDTSFSTYI